MILQKSSVLIFYSIIFIIIKAENFMLKIIFLLNAVNSCAA